MIGPTEAPRTGFTVEEITDALKYEKGGLVRWGVEWDDGSNLLRSAILREVLAEDWDAGVHHGTAAHANGLSVAYEATPILNQNLSEGGAASMALTSTGTGQVAGNPVGSGTATLALTSTGTGQTEGNPTGSGDVSIALTTSGIGQVEGNPVGSGDSALALTSTATGQKEAMGAGTSSLALTTTGTGQTPDKTGSGTSSLALTTSATGKGPDPARVLISTNTRPPNGTGLGKIGPYFRPSDDKAYVFCFTAADVDNITPHTASDGGQGSWSALTGSGVWTIGGSVTGWAAGDEIDDISTFQVGSTIHAVAIYGEQASPWDLCLAYRSFDMTNETWNADEHVIEDNSNTLNWGGSPGCSMVVRSNGDIFVAYNRGATDNDVWWTWYDASATSWSSPSALVTGGYHTIRMTIIDDEICLFLEDSAEEAFAWIMSPGSETWSSIGTLSGTTGLVRNRHNMGRPSFLVDSQRHHMWIGLNGAQTQVDTDRVVAGAQSSISTADISGSVTTTGSGVGVCVGNTGSRNRIWAAWVAGGNELGYVAADQEASSETWDTATVHDSVSDAQGSSRWAANCEIHTRSDGSTRLAIVYYTGTQLAFAEIDVTESPTSPSGTSTLALTATATGTGPSATAPSVRSWQDPIFQNGSSDTHTLTIPSDAVSGDLLLAHFSHDNNQSITSTPTGWSTVVTTFWTGGVVNALYYAVCGNGGNNNADDTAQWVWDGTNDISGQIIVVQDADTSGTPINQSWSGQGSAAQFTLGSVTPNVANCLILGLAVYDGFGSTGAGAAWTTAESHTEHYDRQAGTAGDAHYLLISEPKTAADQAYSFTITLYETPGASGAGDQGGHLLAIAPA